jgi:hypothetical protein
VTLKDAVLGENARAVGQLSDRIRARGGTWADTMATVRKIYRDAGRREPSESTIDAWLYKCDWEEAQG